MKVERQGNMDALGLPQHRSASRSKPTSALVSNACCTSTAIRSELSCLALHSGTASSAFDLFNTSSDAELKRFANHAKIVKSQPAKESGEQ